MRNVVMTLALAGLLIAGLAGTPALYAQEPQGAAQRPDNSMKGPDMQRMMKMMKMMEMMVKCDKMMEGGMMQGGMMGDHGPRKPNEK